MRLLEAEEKRKKGRGREKEIRELEQYKIDLERQRKCSETENKFVEEIRQINSC